MEKMKLDDWQKEILETEGNIVLRSGRQVGKSTIISIKAANYALKNSNKTVMVVAAVERQAQLLFEKILYEVESRAKTKILKGKDRPTKSKLKLKNGSVIYCLPTGLNGLGIRGYTVDLLICDEAAFIPEAVFTAITPMLATRIDKQIWLLSTPFGKRGYFYEAFNKDDFSKFHVSSEDCPRISQDYLKQEKEKMTDLQYAQEYLGEFVDELRQFFPTDVIEKSMTLKVKSKYSSLYPYSIGVDVARLGGDETVITTLQLRGDSFNQVDMEISKNWLTTDTTRKILEHNKKWNPKKIYIDDGGLGVGVLDNLLENNKTKRKTVAINNAKRSLDNDKEVQRKIFKEDLYNNLLNLMLKRKINLLESPEVLLSLKSVQMEYTNNKLKIFGNYTHIAEALVRAAWFIKDKPLNIWIR